MREQVQKDGSTTDIVEEEQIGQLLEYNIHTGDSIENETKVKLNHG